MSKEEIRKRNEQVKEWLWRYLEAKKDVRRLEEELEELKETQESAGALTYSDMPKGSGQTDLSDDMVARDKLVSKILKARYKRIQVFKEIKNAIERLPTADEREIVSLRYLRGRDWGIISVNAGVTLRHVYRIHGRALYDIWELNKDVIECH